MMVPKARGMMVEMMVEKTRRMVEKVGGVVMGDVEG
jgi:hypothetical protein